MRGGKLERGKRRSLPHQKQPGRLRSKWLDSSIWTPAGTPNYPVCRFLASLHWTKRKRCLSRFRWAGWRRLESWIGGSRWSSFTASLPREWFGMTIWQAERWTQKMKTLLPDSVKSFYQPKPNPNAVFGASKTEWIWKQGSFEKPLTKRLGFFHCALVPKQPTPISNPDLIREWCVGLLTFLSEAIRSF